MKEKIKDLSKADKKLVILFGTLTLTFTVCSLIFAFIK